MNRDEAQRIAGSVNMLRPEWPVSSLMTTLAKPELQSRPWRDVLIALTWVAGDQRSRTPGRVLEAGPWWLATRAEHPTTSAITTMCPEHPSERAWECQPCAASIGDAKGGLAAVRGALRQATVEAQRQAADMASRRAEVDA